MCVVHSGIVSTAAALDRETDAFYSLVLVAYDPESEKVTQLIDSE